MLLTNINNKRHLAVMKVNNFREKYFKAVNAKSSFFTVNNKIVITKFAKFYLMELESKFKTLN
jgi:hypothetical protein